MSEPAPGNPAKGPEQPSTERAKAYAELEVLAGSDAVDMQPASAAPDSEPGGAEPGPDLAEIRAQVEAASAATETQLTETQLSVEAVAPDEDETGSSWRDHATGRTLYSSMQAKAAARRDRAEDMTPDQQRKRQRVKRGAGVVAALVGVWAMMKYDLPPLHLGAVTLGRPRKSSSGLPPLNFGATADPATQRNFFQRVGARLEQRRARKHPNDPTTDS